MLNFLEVPDFHFSPKWADVSIKCGHKVAEEARRQEVDFISVPADFFDAPIYANNKGGMDIAKGIVKEWLDVCPVVAVEGTPSHDAPGCYGIFEEMGLVLMKPNKVYGYYGEHVIEVDERKGYMTPLAILFGIPELNKNTIQAKLSLTAEEANAEVLRQFSVYINSFVAPMRLKHAGIPAVGLLHGNVSDSHRTNETDIILKSSDIVIYTEDLLPANLDRWSLGHIHTPWESEKICAGYSGYPGIDKNPWGKRDFFPAFNLVEIRNYKTEGIPDDSSIFKAKVDDSSPFAVGISRLPYGTPMRKKIKHSSEVEPFSDIAYWLDTEDKTDELPEGLHEWSRRTLIESRVDTRRVSKEETEAVKSLWDLFQLIDKDVDLSLKGKVDLITETIKHTPPGKKDVSVDYLRVYGCILFDGKTVELDFSNLVTGLNGISGQNGAGKSSLLSFCHQYPSIIGKDKGKVLKNFFNKKDSGFEKHITYNGEQHKHVITIKAAHTKTAKTECFLSINGKPQLEKASFDEMMEKCEELYGSMADYRITTFCEQPQQATANVSGLMGAKPIDARNIVQAIAGVDREQEKRFALDQVAVIEKDQEKALVQIETLEEALPETEGLIEEKTGLEDEASEAAKELLVKTKNGATASKALENLRKESELNNDKIREKKTVEEKIEQANSVCINKAAEKIELEKLSGAVAENKSIISIDNKVILEIERIEAIEKRNFTLKTANLQKISDYNQAFFSVETDSKYLDRRVFESRDFILNSKQEIKTLQESVNSMVENKKIIAKDDLDIIQKQENDEIEKRSLEAQSAISQAEKMIEILNQPCEHCGKLPTLNQEKTEQLKKDIEENKPFVKTVEKIVTNPNREQIIKEIHIAESAVSEIEKIETAIKESEQKVKDSKVLKENLVFPDEVPEPEYEEEPNKPVKLLTFERDSVLQDITKGESAASEIANIQELIKSKTAEIGSLTELVSSIVIDTEIDGRIKESELVLAGLRNDFKEKSVEVERITGSIKTIDSKLADIEQQEKRIEELKASLDTSDLEAWKYIAKMLGADKIPALELEMFLTTIDSEATDNIEPFLDGRYSIETTTQDFSKKVTVDRFDIIVTDRETGKELSLFSWNPGNKAFFSDAYIKALIRQRNERMNRRYSPIIFDESDAPIKEDRIPMYYEMNRKYFEKFESKVLVVSQKDSAQNYMGKVIKMEELKS